MSAAPAVSIVITAALLAGLALRRRPRVHVPWMAVTVAADLGLLLWVELQARATATVAGGGLPGWLWIHVGLALACIAGYVCAAVTGIVLWRNRRSPIRSLHRANGWTVVAARLGLLVTTPGLFFPPLTP